MARRSGRKRWLDCMAAWMAAFSALLLLLSGFGLVLIPPFVLLPASVLFLAPALARCGVRRVPFPRLSSGHR